MLWKVELLILIYTGNVVIVRGSRLDMYCVVRITVSVSTPQLGAGSTAEFPLGRVNVRDGRGVIFVRFSMR